MITLRVALLTLTLPVVDHALGAPVTGSALPTTCPTAEVHAVRRPELMVLQWGGFNPTRPDGTARYWDPQPLIELGAVSVCVYYRPRKPDGDRWYNTGMIPPRLLADLLAETRPELQECHRHGIGVIGYADCIMFHPELLAAGGVSAEGLAAVDLAGKPVINRVWDPSGTHVSCINNPRWLALQKAVAEVTAQAGFDGLQFDVYPYAIEPGFLCRCDHCARSWAEHSKKKWGDAAPMPGDAGQLDFNRPADRALVQWRWQGFVGSVKAIEEHVHRRFPEFTIIMNHAGGTPDFMYEAAAGALDWPSSELWSLKLGDESSLHLYRMSAAVSHGPLIGLVNALTQIQPAYRYRVALAEALAGGGSFYLTLGTPELAQISHPYARFVRENREWLENATAQASCALLYSWRDQAFLQGDRKQTGLARLDHPGKHYQRAAEILARRYVSYDCVVMEKGLTVSQLGRYPVIVAPELKLVDEPAADCLQQYVEGGGRLLVLGTLGDLKEVNGQYIRRDRPLLTEWTGRSTDEDWQAELGTGRVAFVRQFTAEKPEQPGQPAPAFDRAARSLGLGSGLVITSDSPVEATVRGHGPIRTLFLIRLGPVESVTDRSVRMDYELPADVHVRQVHVCSPEMTPGEPGVTWKESAGRLHVDIGQMEQFVMIGVRLGATGP
ncbi:MAG: hypothetical protein AMXMBFR13_24030 [Phycisphaerae bacterium]